MRSFMCLCCCLVEVATQYVCCSLLCYETGVALGIELEDKMPQHEYYEYFGPDYTLHVAPSNMENKNSRQILEDIRSKLLDNLSTLQHAPSVQFQERPPDTELPEADEDQEDADSRWDPDSDTNDEDRKPIPSRVRRENVEPEGKGAEDMKTEERLREVESTFAESTSLKGGNSGSVMIDGGQIKMEQGSSNKPFDQPADTNS